MGTCMSKKKMSSSAAKSVSTSTPQLQPQTVTVFNSKVESERLVSQKENKQKDEQSQVKKEVFIIKHRKSNDGGASDREKISKHACSDGVSSIPMTNYVAAEAKVDEILLECGRLSRNSSGKVVSSGERGRGRKHSGSKRSQDFDHCENDTTTIAIGNNDLFCEDDGGLAGENQPRLRQHRNRRRSPVPSSERRRRTPSRERDQQQRSSSRERRCSRSPSKRSSDTTTCNLTNNTTTRPGKMFSVPATVSSLSMDKSYNGDGATVRVIAKRNVGSASPRSQSPSRANGNKVTLLSENQQQQPSMSRNSSRKAEQSPHRRNPLSEIDVNSLAYTQSVNNNSSRFQSRPKREIESHANQRIKADTNSNTESRRSSMKTKEQQEEEEVKGQSSMTENVNLKTTIIPPSGLDNFKPQASTLTRSRSSRRSRDLDYLLLNPETVAIPAQSYTSLLLEDIQNFHQMNNNNITPSVTLPACVAKVCSILEAVADLNSSTRSNLSANHYAKRVPDSSIKEHPFVESEVNVIDDVMEPSLHKYVTVSRDGSLLGGVIDMEGQESSACNNFTVSGQRHVGFSSSSSSSSSVKPNSGNPTDSWNPSKRREFDFQRIRSGRFSDIKDVHAIPIVVTTAEST
ncbi:uncharacterized protein At1g65710-like [Prosopis cineraria]|uniref:uncharacterized protein At1g65710-like n=1 Tax=Prosopis cineraria TaxID=364024 RepID=UPI00240ECD77|nr:uncharacterized protein At1g65710-like [Prosopis cineraria]